MTCLILFLLAIATFFQCQCEPVVTIPLGSILGTIETSRKGIEYYSFRGIPYAEPPVGDLRFRPPVPIKAWDGIYNATQDGPVCAQPSWEGSVENCLVVNVYTRRINETEDAKPVLVYIHGGAFVHYTGSSMFFGPAYLMDHDIVVVTFNYRLGTFGFFSTGDKYAPGNYGMKDQVEVLRWVQNHIKYFGGDPSRVTIAGESAGAFSVGLHLFSPMSRGLFHGAIAASGSGLNSMAIDIDPLKIAKRQAALLNCTTNNTQDMVSCMKQVSAEQISNIYMNLQEWHILTTAFLSPVIEEEDLGNERFLTKHPLTSLLEGDIADVPIFMGTTKDEMAPQIRPVMENEPWVAELSANWNEILPLILHYEPNDTISEKLREFYFGSLDQPLTNESFGQLSKLYSDAQMIFTAIRAAKLTSEKNTQPLYLYQFNYQGEYSMDYWTESNKPYGVVHADDMIYLFVALPLYPMVQTEGDKNCMERMTTLWKNFIETGNPTPESIDLLDNVIWKPFVTSNPMYLDIDKNLTLVQGLYYEDRMQLWENLFPIDK